MNASPDSAPGPDSDPDSRFDPDADADPGFESLLRQRASRLAKPDPAWRDAILEAAQNLPEANSLSPSRPRRGLWKTRWFPASLAACWLAIPVLNWSARVESKRFSHYANAQAASMMMGGWDKTVVLASASRR